MPTRCAAYPGAGKQAASDKINTIPTDLSETARTHHDREKRQRLEQKTLCAQTAQARAAEPGKRRELAIYNKSQETSWLAAGVRGGLGLGGPNKANDTSGKARGMHSSSSQRIQIVLLIIYWVKAGFVINRNLFLGSSISQLRKTKKKHA